MDINLKGKTVLVTGASSGIGAETARAVRHSGADIILSGRNKERLDEVASRLKLQSSHVIAGDIAEAPEALCSALDHLPQPDILIHAAGIARNKPFEDVTPQDFDDTFAVNLRAIFFVTQHVVRQWLEDGRAGVVLTISSQMGHVGGPERTVYSASKHAVEGLTKSLTIEYAAKGMRFLTLCPTFVDTPLAAKTLSEPKTRSWVESSIPAGRLATTREVAETAVFLVSDKAAMMTGSAVLLDGGWTAA